MEKRIHIIAIIISFIAISLIIFRICKNEESSYKEYHKRFLTDKCIEKELQERELFPNEYDFYVIVDLCKEKVEKDFNL